MKQMNDDIHKTILTKKPKKGLLSTLLSIFLPIVIVGIFAWQIHKDWDSIVSFDWKFNTAFAIIAFFLLLTNTALEVGVWNKTLGWFTQQLPYRLAIPTYVWSSVARYIPGKVASFFVRLGLTLQLNVPAIPMLAASTVELAVRTASGFFMILLSFLIVHTGEKSERSIIIAGIIIIVVVLVVAHPKIMIPIMNWFLRKIKQPEIMIVPKYRSILLVFGLNVFRWIIYGSAFAMLCASIYKISLEDFIPMIGIAPGSWAAGFVLLSPGGLGFAEWIQNFGINNILKVSTVALILPVLFRLSTLAAEGIWSLIGIPCWKGRDRYVEQQDKTTD